MRKNMPQRKNIRLKQYDYSKIGCYFITICTTNREKVISKINTDNKGNIKINLTIEGKIVDESIKQIESKYSNAIVDEYVIMPNHIHIILEITEKRETNISKII